MRNFAKNCLGNLDVTKICITFVPDSETNYMVDVAQLVRVTDCGSEGRGFESHLPPKEQTKQKGVENLAPFVFIVYGANLFADTRL